MVLLVTVVGIVLVIALLTIPAAVAGRFASRLSQMMAVAVAVSAALTTGGLVLSFEADLPAGATIILLAGAAYLVIVASKRRADGRRGPTQRRASRNASGAVQP